ncbi:MAG: NAD-dependent epimerase/dehydratase family protein [Leptospiraceae bacterium]|nr:NAD-dependent epimerase/dehydratase family protein [Leptospiraceae bacterium]MCP5500529.1 NAD-dependent epimerase/dehydratase family protein [Leptospiraceae bacterium]
METANSVLITGGGGFIGSKTIEVLLKSEKKPQKIISVDVREVPIEKKFPGVEYLIGDIRSQTFFDILKEHSVDTIVHLASIVTPGKNSNREFEYSVDVKGTENVLQASVKAGVEQFIVTSSGAAYGYYEDNPHWIKETDEIRGNEEFAYSHHKRLVEEILKDYREKYPQLKQLIFRPGTILGKGVKNQITDLFEMPFILDIKDSDSRFVIIWDEDVANCILKGIQERKSGIYNLAGSGTLNMKQIADILNKPYIVIPADFLRGILYWLKLFNLSQYGPEQVKFLQYRPVLANNKLIEEFGYTPQKTTEEVFNFYLKEKGIHK